MAIGEWRQVATPEGYPAPVWTLFVPPRSPTSRFFIGFIDRWQDRYDYILIQGANSRYARDNWEPPFGLELVADEGYAMLYRVRRP